MNRIKRIALSAVMLLSGIVWLSSCATERPISKAAPDNNPSYRVEYLFEHDGCKVYRFMDMGHYIYFTNCQGDVSSMENDSVRTVNKIRREPLKISKQPIE